MKRLITGLLTLVLLVFGPTLAFARTWTDIAGRTVEGVFQNYDGRSRMVTLSLESGEIKSFRVEFLSEKDRSYILKQLTEQGLVDSSTHNIPLPGSKLPGDPDQTAAHDGGAQSDIGMMNQNQGDTVGSVNAPPIPLNQLNGGFNSGLPNPLQSGGPRGGRGQNLGGVGRPNGFASGGGVGRQFGAGSAAPTTQLMNGLNGGDYANAAARGLGSEVSNREFGPTSNNSPESMRSYADPYNRGPSGFGGAARGNFGGQGPLSPSTASANSFGGYGPNSGTTGLERGGPPSPLGKNGILGRTDASPDFGSVNSDPTAAASIAGVDRSDASQGELASASDPFGSGFGSGDLDVLGSQVNAPATRGPSNDPTDFGLSSGTQTVNGVAGDFSSASGGSEVDEFKYIGMALVGGAICGAFGSVMIVALVVVIINMSRSQRPPNPVRYS